MATGFSRETALFNPACCQHSAGSRAQKDFILLPQLDATIKAPGGMPPALKIVVVQDDGDSDVDLVG